MAYTSASRKRLSQWIAWSVAAAEPTWVDVPKPIWETVGEIGASVPDAVWQQVPPDLVARLDEYLYPRHERD